MKIRYTMLAAALMITACSGPAVMTRVALKVIPPEGGKMSYLEIDTAGVVHGGHMSGTGSAIIVREDTLQLPVAEAREIFALARAVPDSMLDRERSAPTDVKNSTEIGVLYSDNSQARIQWRAGRLPDARVRALADRLLTHKTTNWE